jgi:hypothetical protein
MIFCQVFHVFYTEHMQMIEIFHLMTFDSKPLLLKNILGGGSGRRAASRPDTDDQSEYGEGDSSRDGGGGHGGGWRGRGGAWKHRGRGGGGGGGGRRPKIM